MFSTALRKFANVKFFIAVTALMFGIALRAQTITAVFNPIWVPENTSTGTAQLLWNAPGYTGLSIYVGLANQPHTLMAAGLASSGSITVQNWVSNGMKFYLTTANQAKILSSTTVTVAQIGRGGSDYLCVSSGNPCPGVIATYNVNSSQISSQLQTMYNNGQRRLRIPIFFGRGLNDGFSMDSTGGNLSPQNRQNLANLLAKIRSVGFVEVEVGFFPNYKNAINGWTTWSEDYYQENWNTIANLRPIVANSGLTYKLDLNNEGIPTKYLSNYPVFLEYVQTLWANYTSVFGKNDTIGFSLIPDHYRIQEIPNVYQGNYPYAFDIHFYEGNTQSYGDLASTLVGVKNDLQAINLGSTGWIIGESDYNDANEANIVRSFILSTGQTVFYLCQWPLTVSGQTLYSTPLFSGYSNVGF